MPTANDRFKARFTNWYWMGVSAATLLHFIVLVNSPVFGAARYDTDDAPPIVVQPIAPDLPPPPDVIPRPALPVIGGADVSPDVTISPAPFESYRPPPPPPPQPNAGAGVREHFETFVPSMTAPRVLNATEVERALERAYPALLREAGIGGTVSVSLWLDDTGTIVRSVLTNTSGYAAMDEAAMKVVEIMKLSPALNRGRAVRVVVTIPIVFNVK